MSIGGIINLIQLDSAKLAFVLNFCPDLISMPIKMIVYNVFMFNLLGYSYISGFITLLILLIILLRLSNLQRLNLRDLLKSRDERMKFTTELINSLKILKLYSWESFYLNKVNGLREEELKHLKRKFNISTVNFFVFWLISPLMCVISIGFYQRLSGEFNFANIITSIALFNDFHDIISGLPYMIQNVLEMFTCLGRIEVNK